jgi:NADPH-dependent 2,4-dienoyl-CoA reductase/sulfur reductase-like enzyme
MSVGSQIVVVGAGPAGLAAAVRAAQCGAQVQVIDDNHEAGGQIWRNQSETGVSGRPWFRRFGELPIRFLSGAQVISADHSRRALLVETQSNVCKVRYEQLILATGARELFLPFPGWTLPNVMGAGGLQALVKSGLPVDGKRIVVAGSGPLLLATAACFRAYGARVKCIAEQASSSALLRFGARLLLQPTKLWQALRLRASLARTRYLPGCWVEAAEGRDAVRAVRLRRGGRTWTEACDYLAVSYGLTPNLELAQLLGCRLRAGTVEVDERQRTSLDHVYAAGECTGIGGSEQALIEGEIAGYLAAGAEPRARKLFARRRRADRFAHSLARTFALRPELRTLARPDTIVCRCEDVALANLHVADSWRAAKLHHRCGMGPCQGRICGPIIEALFGWTPASIRPPIFPARLASLAVEGVEQSL